MRELPRVAQSLDFTCGAACFESLYRYLRPDETSPGEMFFARELGSLDLGYTPPENVEKLARRYGFDAVLRSDADFAEIEERQRAGEVIFVTWWDEDAGHYSLVRDITVHDVLLMDPWAAREGVDTRLSRADFLTLWRQRGSRYVSVKEDLTSTDAKSGP